MAPNLTQLKQIKALLQELLEKMGVTADIATHVGEEHIFVDMSNVTPDPKVIIGQNGDTLLALQLVLSLIAGKKAGLESKLVLDVDAYRAKREQSLVALAKRLAAQVEETGQKVILDPLRPFERRIVHMTLQKEFPHLHTESIGEEPFRRIVITKQKPE
ncbi:MAG: R3H domain-containing nucleic acid-binding protein [bacterium]